MLAIYRYARKDRGSAKGPVGRPSQTMANRFYEDFEYQTACWDKLCWMIAKIEWYPVEMSPKVGFIITNPQIDPD